MFACAVSTHGTGGSAEALWSTSVSISERGTEQWITIGRAEMYGAIYRGMWRFFRRRLETVATGPAAG
jgi:hypothetical protein